jgi:peptidase E
VVALDRFDALGLVGFNINPHYQEADPLMAAYSETRDDRIREYHVVDTNPVVGLESAWRTANTGSNPVGATKLFLLSVSGPGSRNIRMFLEPIGARPTAW